MASGEFTPELCEQLHEAPKYVPSRISWKDKNPGGGVLVFRAKAFTGDGEGLGLVGYWNNRARHGLTRWGFSLTYNKNVVRSYDMAKKHKNPGEEA